MKWLEIQKAKPKFNQQYLIANTAGIYLGALEKTEQTMAGLSHTFKAGELELTQVSHIAQVENPNEKGDE